MSWTASTDNVGVVSYGLSLDGSSSGSTSSTSYTFSGLSCGTTHQVGVVAVDAAGNRSAQSSLSVTTSPCPDTSPPTSPWPISAGSITATSVTLAWSASIDDVGVAGYDLYVGNTRAATVTQSPQQPLVYLLAGLSCGTAYTFGVDAYDAAGNVSPRSTTTATTSPCADTTPPSAPTGLTATSVTQTGWTFGWTAATDNIGVAGYTVYLNGTKLGQTTSTSYDVSGLTCGTQYAIAVEAFDPAGNVSSRPLIHVTTSACPVALTTPSTTTTTTATPTTTTPTTTTTTTPTTTPTTPTTTTTPASPSPAPAQVFLSPSGDDATCVRGNASRPCASFDRAYQIAQGGDTVSAAGGQYAEDAPSIGGNEISPDSSKTGTVTFVCAGSGDVTFAGAVFHFWAGTSGVTVQGDCFHFHVIFVGEGGYTEQTHDITLDAVHMESFDIMGARNVTISNSEVGPFVACGVPEMPAFGACDAGSYWARFPNGTDAGGQQEPFIHNGGAGPATNIVLDNVHIHGISSKWNGTHTGGLLVWNVNGLTIKNSTFDHDAVYDIEENAGSFDSAVTMTNNTFGAPVYSFDPNEPSQNTPLPDAWRDVTIGGSGSVLSNWLIQGNTFTNGVLITTTGGGSFTNVQVNDNKLGTATTCVTASGLAFSGNDSCG